MKLCIVANPNSIHVRRWVRHFAASHEVILLAIREPTSDVPAEVQLHDLTKIVNIPKLRFAIWPIVMRRLLKRLKPDLIHAHWISGAGWVAAATDYHPFVVSVLGSDLLVLPRRSRVYDLLSKWVLRRADYVTCISEPLMDEARLRGVPENRLELLGLGVDTAVFCPPIDKHETRRALGTDNGPVVISIRAFKPIYNPLDIARAIPLVLEQVPDTTFLIQTYNADADLLEAFDKMIRRSEVAHAVRYVPDLQHESEIASYYQAADIAVSLASSDGTPVSVQEVMACGTATVLGDIPAFRKWARHEQETLLVPLHDTEALSEAMVRLLRDKETSNRLAQNALAYVRANANRATWMQRGEEIYAKVISDARHQAVAGTAAKPKQRR